MHSQQLITYVHTYHAKYRQQISAFQFSPNPDLLSSVFRILLKIWSFQNWTIILYKWRWAWTQWSKIIKLLVHLLVIYFWHHCWHELILISKLYKQFFFYQWEPGFNGGFSQYFVTKVSIKSKLMLLKNQIVWILMIW